MIMLFLLQALMGLASPLNKQVLALCPSSLFAAIKLSMAGFILLLYHVWYKRKPLYIPRSHWVYYAQIISFGMIGVHVLKYWGLQHISATKMAFLYGASPLCVALVSSIRFHDSFTKKQIIGMIICFFAFIPMLFTSSIVEYQLGEFFYISWPELAVLVAVLLHAISTTSKRILLQANNYWPVSINGICLLLGGFILFIVWYLYDGVLKITVLPVVIGYSVLTMFITKIICSNIKLYLMKSYTPAFLSFIDSWYPIFVALWSRILFGEFITWHVYIASMILCIGQYLFYQDELQAKPMYFTQRNSSLFQSVRHVLNGTGISKPFYSSTYVNAKKGTQKDL